ncbi:hypothetical protein ACLKA6_000833 [Drosophila palustris]
MFQRKLKFLLLIGICTSIKAEEIPSCDYFDTVDLTGIEKLSNGSYNYEGVVIPHEQTGTYNYKILFEGTNITYSLFVWGIASGLLLIIILTNHLLDNLDIEDNWKVGCAYFNCIFKCNDWSIFIYLLGPATLMILIKAIFMISTICHVHIENRKNRKQLEELGQPYIKNNVMFTFYLRILTTEILNWITELCYVLYFTPIKMTNYLLGIVTYFNLIYFILIFAITITRRDVRQLFARRSFLPVLFLDLYPSGVTSFDTFNGLRLVGAKAPPSCLLPPPCGDRIAACPRVQLLPGGQIDSNGTLGTWRHHTLILHSLLASLLCPFLYF